MLLKKLSALAIIGACILSANSSLAQKGKTRPTATVTNLDKDGRQITRFNTVGDAVDAHDGEIALFNGVYYLYGTSYDCGFEWQNKNAAFCGFKTYSSTDMVTWKDEGFLFDAQTPVWQKRCNGNTYGCFRPHVVFNNKTNLYVLWVNVYDNVSGYRVFTATKPTGPFTEVAEPKLTVNAAAPAGALNNGDHDTFIDDDGTAYLAFTDWRSGGAIVIEKLSADYLTGTGEVSQKVTATRTEAPGMFKRNGIYYVVYSDPNCGYCAGTGASYKTATSPLGPWSEGKKISDNSCGGQPSFVSTLKLGSGTVFLFGSDLWNNAAKNEALANYYWAPLRFNDDGSIIPMDCNTPFKISTANNKPAAYKPVDGYLTHADISKSITRSQSFTATASGNLNITLTTLQTGYPNADLQVSIFKADKEGLPTGNALATAEIANKSIGWSAKQFKVQPKLKVVKGQAYSMVLSTASTTGAYGFAYRDIGKIDGVEAYSKDGGESYTVEKGRTMRFSVAVSK
ncbi:family 43 glycosylhydrolase [Mucilaginibacter myungsuensis]|uniref:Family 43 glycosylhydrolase n=1 Tax=Mucilaginibacter myungsuensis TaxID=649104 RepID=A0A929L067_9SPHI|nr:family 43 glycosylhydrolase [Mucilaginibacter myungsuensis]MBE9660886.1 family 43 glycosylhydrolase [Mucilaginibacter myungsuensis]MDN3600933.1 family 43 glycosylhydrolase [Mucilaginibacter myungsuensis]